MMRRRRRTRLLVRIVLSASLWLASGPSLPAQEGAQDEPFVAILTVQQPDPPRPEAADPSPVFQDAFFPPRIDPISRIPNFFGGFFGRGAMSCSDRSSSRTLVYTSSGGADITGSTIRIGSSIFGIDPFAGPGGPFTVNSNVTGTGAAPTFVANENTELTGLIRGSFPGASFVNGTMTLTEPGEVDTYAILFNYLFRSGVNVCVNLPNPAGGGLIGRNKFFENGSPLPRDRVYFFYNLVGRYPGLGPAFDINRYVGGIEKTFLGGLCSVEVRLPFAGTANSTQTAGQVLDVNHPEFGNVGIALKVLLVRTPYFVASAGLGLSVPTADDSRMLIGNTPAVVIQNCTCLLQPLLGLAWAPTDRFYAQSGLQFDLDPSGNPVLGSSTGSLSQIGVLRDQAHAFLNNAAGYWIVQNDGRRLSGIILQGEMDYDGSFGGRGAVQSGAVTVTDLSSQINVLYGAAGVIFQFGTGTRLSIAASTPLSGGRLYDWSVIAQLNVPFGRLQ